MMRWVLIASLAVAATVAAPSTGGTGPADPMLGAVAMTAQNSDPLSISGPDAADPGQAVDLAVYGVTLADLTAAIESGLMDRTVWPEDGVRLKSPYDWWTRKVELSFEADAPGVYRVSMYLVRDGALEIAHHVITVGDGPKPPPGPDPPPLPPNPYREPNQEWKDATAVIRGIPMTRTDAPLLAEWWNGLASRVAAGAVPSTADLSSAVRQPADPPDLSKAYPEHATAAEDIIERTFGTAVRPLPAEQAGYVLRALAWSTWESME